jgi:hypothetical protein
MADITGAPARATLHGYVLSFLMVAIAAALSAAVAAGHAVRYRGE